jgi:hypothetical protein
MTLIYHRNVSLNQEYAEMCTILGKRHDVLMTSIDCFFTMGAWCVIVKTTA